MLVTFSRSELTLADIPKPVWLLIDKVLVPVLEIVFGFRPFYPEYIHEAD